MKAKAVIVSLACLGLALATATASSKEITLPADHSALRTSNLPGYGLAQQKCGICHSADYINYQAPGLSQAQWTAEVTKMQHSYGAPLEEQEIASIGAYLAVAYGSAKATDASVIAASPSANVASRIEQPTATIDVAVLLDSNACSTCHAVDKKVVGPAFHEIAARYKAVSDANVKVAASIRNGGVGRWGDVPMPPMPALTEAQINALAAYVLKQ
ncbi:MAG: c-type cytochrome [Dokdonella sp.]